MRAPDAALARAGALALFLDVDGTLVEIAATPDAACAPHGLADMLARLERALGGALALVSGRDIAALDALLRPFRGCAAGAHGGQWRDGAGGEVFRHDALDPALIAAARVFAADLGVIFEDKGVSFALHFRGRDEMAPALESGLEQLIGRAREPLALMRGRKVFEVLRANNGKSSAIAHFMARPPFAGRIPLMIGDDTTDLSAIEACRARNGFGFRVAGGRFSLAEAEFSGPAELRGWLDELIAELTQTRSPR